MLLRSLLGYFFLFSALIVVALTLLLRGAPMGYRGAMAIVYESVGGNELRVSQARPIRVQPGVEIPRDAELRTGPYSTLTLSTPYGDIDVYDNTKLHTRSKHEQAGPNWTLASGRLRINADGEQSLLLGVLGAETKVELTTGVFLLTADGKGTLSGSVASGALLVHEGKGRPVEVSAGQVFLTVPRMPTTVTTESPQPEIQAHVNPRANTGDLATVSGQVSPGGRVYINGELSYPDASGAFVSAIAPGSSKVVVVAEDLSGSSVRQELTLAR